MKREEYFKAPAFMERLMRLIYPVKCMICDSLLREDTILYICDTCYKNLPRFGHGFQKISQLTYIDGVLAALYYENGVDTAIQSMKFKSQPRLSKTMSAIVYEEIVKESMIPDFDFIIPIPMHLRKQRQRGYNQSELVARELSKYLNIPVCSDILIKERYTKPQVGLHRQERLCNLEGAFRIKENTNVSGRSILLVDDVVTTGTTLNTCAKILVEHNASFVYAAVIARAEK